MKFYKMSLTVLICVCFMAGSVRAELKSDPSSEISGAKGKPGESGSVQIEGESAHGKQEIIDTPFGTMNSHPSKEVQGEKIKPGGKDAKKNAASGEKSTPGQESAKGKDKSGGSVKSESGSVQSGSKSTDNEDEIIDTPFGKMKRNIKK